MNDNLQLRELINRLKTQAGSASESELARQIGLPQQTIHRLLSGATPDPRISTLRPIAKHFHITIGQLTGDEPISPMRSSNDAQQTYSQIPLVQWEQLNSRKEVIASLTRQNWFDWVVTNLPISQSSYALKVRDKSLLCPFAHGATMVIDPEVEYEDNDTVIIYDDESQSAYLRNILFDGERRFLRPLKEGIEATELTDSAQLQGVVVQIQTVLKEIKRAKQ